MNARQRREFAEIEAAGGSIECYPSPLLWALLRLVGRRQRPAGTVVYLDDRRAR